MTLTLSDIEEARTRIRDAVDLTPCSPSLIKVTNTRRYGATIVLAGSSLSEAMVEARRLEAEQGLVMVHPYDDEAVIAGQGTIALEILEQCPGVTHAIVPIGGGGVISGVALGLKSHDPDIKVIGVEASAAPSARMSRDEGRIVDAESGETASQSSGSGRSRFRSSRSWWTTSSSWRRRRSPALS